MVARLLTKEKGWVSGEWISESLGISRAAVAKHISSLRQEGYLIDSASRRGYMCRIIPDVVDVDLIQKSLTTKFLGRSEWRYLPETMSTNQEAVMGASEGLPDGSVILAGTQTTGRGRKGRRWFSPPRSICFSVVLRPSLALEKLPWLMIAATAAVHMTIFSEAAISAQIKWPNDVCINGKKCAGILVEVGLSAGEPEWGVIGIGLNVNAAAEDFPEDLRDAVTSLFEESGLIGSRNILYASLINNLEYFYDLLRQGKEKQVSSYWAKASGLIGENLKIARASDTIEGCVMGLNENGRLIVKRPRGKIMTIESGDIVSLMK